MTGSGCKVDGYWYDMETDCKVVGCCLVGKKASLVAADGELMALLARQSAQHHF